MSPAAALLRRLDAEATGKPWLMLGNDLMGGLGYKGSRHKDGRVCVANIADGWAGPGDAEGCANARLLVTTRNLLPLLAVLVEAAGDAVSSLDRHVGSMAGQFADVDMAVDALRLRLAALEAAAAKEVEK